MCCASMIASAAPTRVAARSKSPRSVAIAASPLMANGVDEPVAGALADLRAPRAPSASAVVEVAQLALDHARGCSLRMRPGTQLPIAADERQPLRHPVAGLGQVAGHLGTDARAGGARSIVRVRRPRLRSPSSASRASRRPSATSVRSATRARPPSACEISERIAEPAADLEGPVEAARGAVVVAHPERHEAGVEEGSGRADARRRRAMPARDRTRPPLPRTAAS